MPLSLDTALQNIQRFNNVKADSYVGNFSGLHTSDLNGGTICFHAATTTTCDKIVDFVKIVFSFGFRGPREDNLRFSRDVQVLLQNSIQVLQTEQLSEGLDGDAKRGEIQAAVVTFNKIMFESRSKWNDLPPPCFVRIYYWVLGHQNVLFQKPIQVNIVNPSSATTTVLAGRAAVLQ